MEINTSMKECQGSMNPCVSTSANYNFTFGEKKNTENFTEECAKEIIYI